MKVLVLGYGSMGRRHAANSFELGHNVAVHDPKPSAFPVDPKIRWFTSELAAYDWGPDAIVIATPAFTHGVLYRRAIAVSKAVFIEKPLATSLADFLAGYQTGDFLTGSDSYVQVGCNWRFHPLVLLLRQHAAVASAAIPVDADFWVMCDSRTWPGHDYADGLLECGSHEIDLAQYFCGKIAGVSDASFEHDGCIWRVTLAHEGGASSRITVSDRAHQARGMRITWPTHVGGYHVPYGDPRLLEDDESSYKLELQYFLQSAAGRRTDAASDFVAEYPEFEHVEPATLSDGLNVLTACDEARALVANTAMPRGRNQREPRPVRSSG